ncbi:MAG TPA: hypothetical protein VGV38_21280 [Pyrinomonadaceae bacterium]|nr:hypothetical protein [Pyrinomonadaceae bacterium]
MNSRRPRTRPSRTLSLVLAAALLLLCVSRPARACGPFMLGAIFVHSVHPDFPLERFARGRMGVLQPSYARSYLVAAYRHLSGPAFERAEQDALVALWRERLDLSPEEPATDEHPRKRWVEARKRVPGVAEVNEVEQWRPASEYNYFLNCTDDAFRTAAATLTERIARRGAEHPLVKAWVEAQDLVFANCSQGDRIPELLGADADPLARADRAYQIAAANFYAQRYDDARTAFEQIARDNSSPWRNVALYLAARAMLRKGSLSEGQVRADALAQSEQLFQKVLNDRALSSTHAGARKLLGLTRLRLRPEARLRELSQAVRQKNSQASLKQDVWDMTVILDKFVGEETRAAELKFKTLPQAALEDDLAGWVLTFQTDDADALAHTLQQWERTRSLPWLVAALTKLDGANPRASAVLDAAAGVAADSPAFASVAFHTARLLAEAGREDEARGRLDAWLAQTRASLPPSALNELLRQRTLLARDLDEFLKFAQRVPTAFSYNEDGREIPVEAAELARDETYKERASGRALFDADAVTVLNNQFPLALLRQAAVSRALPEHLRREVAVAAWTRSVLVGDRETGRALAPVLETLVPELKGLLNDEAGTSTDEQRKFSALYAILKSPGLRPHVDGGVGRTTPVKNIDNYRDNWWCVHTRPAASQSTGETKAAETKPVPRSFPNDRHRLLAGREEARVNALGTAPNFLTRLAIEWATKAPDDPRVPEALHLAVRTTRYGCTDEQTTALSKAAHALLHKRYPRSEWAKKTPYWFKHGG